MGAYKNLAAVVESTKDRRYPLELHIRGMAPDLILAVCEDRRKAHDPDGRDIRTLATAPFVPGGQDDAAKDVARQLQLDGKDPDWI